MTCVCDAQLQASDLETGLPGKHEANEKGEGVTRLPVALSQCYDLKRK